MRRRLAAELGREGVSAAGFSALVVLTTAGGTLELRTLRRRLGWSKANATEVTATLATRGLVFRRRAPEDRRSVVIDLSREGREIVERLFPEHSDRVDCRHSARSTKARNARWPSSAASSLHSGVPPKAGGSGGARARAGFDNGQPPKAPGGPGGARPGRLRNGRPPKARGPGREPPGRNTLCPVLRGRPLRVACPRVRSSRRSSSRSPPPRRLPPRRRRPPTDPGALSHFALARKDCVGTARNRRSKVWFTVADGVLSDVYFPTNDTTNNETLQYVVTDGATFTDLQTRDMTYTVAGARRPRAHLPRHRDREEPAATGSSPTT